MTDKHERDQSKSGRDQSKEHFCCANSKLLTRIKSNKKCFLQNDKTWFKDWKPISFFACRLKELEVADVDVSHVFSTFLNRNLQQLFSFAKNFHMKQPTEYRRKRNETVRREFICVDGVFWEIQLTHRYMNTSFSWECFAGISRSFFKKVQLNSMTLAILELDYVSKWLPQHFQQEKKTLYSARNLRYFVCSTQTFVSSNDAFEEQDEKVFWFLASKHSFRKIVFLKSDLSIQWFNQF